jgi:hypothetical protein
MLTPLKSIGSFSSRPIQVRPQNPPSRDLCSYCKRSDGPTVMSSTRPQENRGT